MLKKRLHCLLMLNILLLLSLAGYGQGQDEGPGYQMMLIKNPGMAGIDGKSTVRLSYVNFFPGNNYNFHSVYFSYDSYYQGLHGGTSVYITDNYLGGIINDLRGGVSYAYSLKAGRDLFINAGLSASVVHRGFNFSGAVLPDQIDPLGGISLPSSESLTSGGKTVIDIGAGFLFATGRFTGGLAVSHLAEPDLSFSGSSEAKLRRQLLIHVSGDFTPWSNHDLKLDPLVYAEYQKGYTNGGAGVSFGYRFFSVCTSFLGDTYKNLNIQSGFSFSAGRFYIYYNYRFNVISGNRFMPLSLLHQTGLAFSLNAVEKRNEGRTINFPNL